jgi:hypothetical protein
MCVRLLEFSLTILILVDCPTGLIHDFPPTNIPCDGKFEVLYESTNTVNTLLSLGHHKKDIKSEGVRKIKRSRKLDRSRIYVDISGNCCWEVYSK